MPRKNAAQRMTREDPRGANDPERPDNVHGDGGDDSIVDIRSGDESVEEVDVNAPARTDDARSDAEKDEEKRQKREREEIRQRAEETGGEVDPPEQEEAEDDDRRGRRARVTQRRDNRRREAQRASDQKVSNLTTELNKTRERLAKLERAGSENEIALSISQLEAKLESLKKELAAAIEAGDTTKQLDLTVKMGEVQGDLALARRDLQAAKNRPQQQQQEAEEREEEREQGTPELVEDFVRANRRWWNLPSAKPLKDAAIEIDKIIKQEIADGDLDFDEYSPEHMDELVARLAEEKEKLGFNDVVLRDFEGEEFVLDDDDTEQEPRGDRRSSTAATGRDKGRDVKGKDRGNSRRAPQGGMGGREGRRGPQSDLELARQGKARLTEEDYAQIRVFKLDPNDPEVRKRFAKERVRTILTEAQKAGAK